MGDRFLRLGRNQQRILLGPAPPTFDADSWPRPAVNRQAVALYLSAASECSGNGSQNWKRSLWAILLGAIGIAIAAGNIWVHFIEWLSSLGILGSPIDAVILVDQDLFRGGAGIDADWRGSAVVAWILGSVTAFVVETNAPEWSTPVSAAIVGGVVYYVMFMLTPAKIRAN